ncbi:MAG: peptide chain release factor-like protein [Chlamydiia bacterium]|nr:peptide chain release factor-like protein [Chlamydiia bacterium]
MTISEEKWRQLKEWMAELKIKEDELQETFILGSGRGGQKMQKTHSCVQLKYREFEFKCQKSRSREDNRFFARRELCAKVEESVSPETSKRLQQIGKLKRQKQRRKRKAKEKYAPDV